MFMLRDVSNTALYNAELFVWIRVQEYKDEETGIEEYATVACTLRNEHVYLFTGSEAQCLGYVTRLEQCLIRIDLSVLPNLLKGGH